MSSIETISTLSPKQTKSFGEVLQYSKQQALRGGIAGGSAQLLNVLSFMWLRTTMNYQYRYGGGTKSALQKLWNEGGIRRMYRGLVPALLQSPLSRFGDTAANVGILAFLDSQETTKSLPIGIRTAAASFGAAGWRLFLMPIDAWKTIKQVEGANGLNALTTKVRQHGILKLYHGGGAAMAATWIGHYPWFVTHNYLSAVLPQDHQSSLGKYIRNACIGFCSSVISDTVSNSVRVVKTTKQTSLIPLTYYDTIKTVVNKDGVFGLLGRGLVTRIITNGLQGMVFSVGWKAIQERLERREGYN